LRTGDVAEELGGREHAVIARMIDEITSVACTASVIVMTDDCSRKMSHQTAYETHHFTKLR